MAVFHTMDFVTDPGVAGGKPQAVEIDGRLSSHLYEQVAAAHEGWSAATRTGLTAPVVSTFPLKDLQESDAEKLYAVTVTWCEQEIRHKCFLVPAAEYKLCGYNPFRFLAESGLEGFPSPPAPFSAESMGRAIDADSIALVAEGLQQFLVRGKLHLPLDAPNSVCDRILALMVMAMPQHARVRLRFTSFSPTEPWAWTLAAVRQPGGSIVDWKRRVLNLMDDDLVESGAAYIRSVRDCLAAGDQRGLEELTSHNAFQPGVKAKSRPAGQTMPERLAPGACPQAMSGKPSSFQGQKPVIGGLETKKSPAPKRSRVVLERRKLRNITLADSRRTRKIPRKVLSALVVLLAGILGWGAGLIPGWSLAELKHRVVWGSQEISVSTASSPLLSVVDVSRSYDETLVEYLSGRGSQNQKEDKARLAALSALDKRAGEPLARQIETYLAVVKKGIQQGGQPGREVRRLDALSQEGHDLDRDLVRLELAWYSLATGVCWRDLGTIGDSQLSARYDSLATEHVNFRWEGTSTLDIQGLADQLKQAMGQAEAMTQLVDLFRATSWSRPWQQELKSAANLVSPAASPVTRAYRNCAFALCRLKDAEHTPESLQVPFGQGWQEGTWPAVTVRTQLPTLRRMAGMFGQGQAPAVVAGTVEIYSLLEDIGQAASRAAAEPEFWLHLHANPAVAFDPMVFDDVLGRLRFEALRPSLDRGIPPRSWPEHLTTQAGAMEIVEFYGVMATDRNPDTWRSYAGEITDPFLSRWGAHLAETYGAAERGDLVSFASAWNEMIDGSAAVRAQAAANEDWTATWLDLHTSALDLLDRYVLAFRDNPVCLAQVAMASNLLATMSSPLTVRMTGATIMLGQDPGARSLVMELQVQPGDRKPLRQALAPAERAETGDGDLHADLDWTLQLDPQQWVTVKVLDEATHVVLLETVCPALLERVGPGGFTRPLTTQEGTVRFTVAPGLWRQLKLPDLASVF